MEDQKPKYNIWTIGCQMNTADSRHLAGCLENFGYEFTDDADEADLVVLNTCVVRDSAERKVEGKLQYLQGLKKHRPAIRIAVMGCFVGRGRTQEKLRKRFPFVDIFMPPSDISPLEQHLDELAGAQASQAGASAERTACGFAALPATGDEKVSANVPAVLGCSHACTYCIIPYRRGREHSRTQEEVLQNARSLAGQGVKEVVFLGQIIDRYGADFEEDYDLADLLREAAQIDGLHRIRFLTSHPAFMTDRIISAVADEEKVCPHFEIPCQSGSDAMLAKMRRGYSRDQFRELIGRVLAKVPDAAIATDIIVGFPGETEAQFMDTYRLAEELRFDMIHIAKYSPRPQTYAARHYADDIPAGEKERRRRMLESLLKETLAEKNRPLLGRRVEVLVEDWDERHGRWRGRTPQNKLVFIEDDRELLGKIVHARIAWAGPFSMLAETASEPTKA